MSTFSEKQGFVKKREAFQVNDMDEALRNSLWNVLWNLVLDPRGQPQSKIASRYIEAIWQGAWRLRADQLRTNYSGALDQFEKRFFNLPFNEVYDLLENTHRHFELQGVRDTFPDEFNSVLKREMSAYRFVGNELARITSDEEIQAIEEAQDSALQPVAEHITRALQLMSDRKHPDHRNSVKESISAVEAQCKLMTGKHSATLGQCLKLLRDNLELHPAFLAGIDKLYGWTSNEDGIRHALMDQSTLQLEDSKYMLVICSAFVNYLKEKSLVMGPG